MVDPRAPDDRRLRRHGTASIQPGTDVAFYNAVMHVLIRRGPDRPRLRPRPHRELRRPARDRRRLPAGAGRAVCGITADTIREVARAIGAAERLRHLLGHGHQPAHHGTDNARCLIALCLLTGNVGRPGTGLHPLRGQNNVQGASDAGLIPMIYPDYQPVDGEATAQKFEAAWGVPLDPKRGLTVVEIMHGGARRATSRACS